MIDTSMPYAIRPATPGDVPHIVHHREQMFRHMGTVCDYEAMAAACAQWYAEAVPAGIYRGWLIEAGGAEVVGGGVPLPVRGVHGGVRDHSQ